MKKAFSLLLSLLMILSLAACIRVKTPYVPTEAQAPAPAVTEVPAPAAEPTAEPAPTEAPAPTAEPTAEPAPASTDAPAPTAEPAAEPMPAETPGSEDAAIDPAIADANSKLGQVTSLHVDMKLNMNIEVVLSLGGMDQRMPLDVSLSLSMDSTADPGAARFEISLSRPDMESNVLAFAVQEDEHTVVYYSEDDGISWQKQTDPTGEQLTLSPDAIISMLSGTLTNVQAVGTAQVNGVDAAVYSGTIPGKYLGALMDSVGSAGELSGVLDGEIPQDLLTDLSDIQVTVMIDETTGLPLRYVVDMTDAIQDLLEAVLREKAGMTDLTEAGVTLEIPSAVLDIVLSQFDSVDPIEVPEAALNAPEA